MPENGVVHVRREGVVSTTERASKTRSSVQAQVTAITLILRCIRLDCARLAHGQNYERSNTTLENHVVVQC